MLIVIVGECIRTFSSLPMPHDRWKTPEEMGCRNALPSRTSNTGMLHPPLPPFTPHLPNSETPFPWFRKSPCQSCQLLYTSPLPGRNLFSPWSWLPDSVSLGSRSQINNFFIAHFKILFRKKKCDPSNFIANNLRDWHLGCLDYLVLAEKCTH